MRVPDYYVCNPLHFCYDILPKKFQSIYYDMSTGKYTKTMTTKLSMLAFYELKD